MKGGDSRSLEVGQKDMSMEMVVGPDPVLTPQPMAADGDCAASTSGTANAVGGVVEQRLRATAK